MDLLYLYVEVWHEKLIVHLQTLPSTNYSLLGEQGLFSLFLIFLKKASTFGG